MIGYSNCLSLSDLTYYNYWSTLRVHPCCHRRLEFFLSHGWIILQCVCTCVCVWEREGDIFIHSSIDEHLVCHPMLAIVNNVAVNRRGKISLWCPYIISFGYIPRIGIAGSYTIFNFLRIAFSIVALPIYIPTNSAQESGLQIFANACYLFLIIA